MKPSPAQIGVLEHARQQSIQQGLPYATAVLTQYLDGDDADWYRARERPGDYVARAADEIWEMGDAYIDDPSEQEATFELLEATALALGGDPFYGRQANPAGARAVVLRHGRDTTWRQRIPGGTDLPPAAFDHRELMRGTAAEIEHATDPHVALEIAMDHLAEDPHYYTRNPPPKRSWTAIRTQTFRAYAQAHTAGLGPAYDWKYKREIQWLAKEGLLEGDDRRGYVLSPRGVAEAQRRRMLNPAIDTDACALGRWAWDRDTRRCGENAPAGRTGASAAARRLAQKRWTLPQSEQRVAARRLRR